MSSIFSTDVLHLIDLPKKYYLANELYVDASLLLDTSTKEIILAQNNSQGYFEILRIGGGQLQFKQSCDLLSDANVALSGNPIIDGIPAIDGYRILLINQTNPIENGIWQITTGGIWVRPVDFENGSDAASVFTFIQQGTNYADTSWVCSDNTGNAVVGTDPLTWVEFGASISICSTPNPQEIYVDANVGNDATGNGSVTCPYKTIQYALTFCTDPTKIYSLILACANYTGADSIIPGNVNIEGNGASIQFNLTLGAVGLAGTDQAPFYVTCGFQEFTFDLSPFSVCLPTFDNCSIDKLTRLDATIGPFLVRFSDGSCNDFSIVGNVAFDNTLFLNTGTVETGGSAFIKNTVVGITIDIDAGGTVLLLAGVFVGPTGILNALDPSAIINIDSSSASGFGGTIVGTTNINYLDNAETIKYIPTTPTDWGVVPTTVQEGLDNLASSVIFIYNSGRIFTQTSDSSTVTNTTTETSIVGSGEGSLSVPADGFAVGDSYQVNIAGHLNSRNNDQLTLRVKTAGGIVFTTFTVIMPTCTNQHFDLKINFTIRQIGGAGVSSIATTTLFTYTKNANNALEGENISTVNNTTFDTTIPNTLEVTAEWNVADPLNSIYTEIFTLFKTY